MPQLFSLETSGLQVLAEVRRLMNCHAPISQLPENVFVMICENVVERSSWRPWLITGMFEQTSTMPITYSVKREYIQPLLTLTHVCRSWRNVVIGHSTFWAYADPTLMPQSLFDTFIERARDTRLFYAFYASESLCGTEKAILDTRGPRLRHLTIHRDDTTAFPRQYATYFPLKASALESLSITSEDARFGIDDFSSDASPYLFHERTSPIRALALSPILRLVPRDSFPSLTHLYISFYRQEVQGVDPLNDLLRLLSNTPMVQFLWVFQIHRVFPPQDPSTHPRLRLPQLRNITIADTHWQYASHLLSHLSLHEDAHIYVTDIWLAQQEVEDVSLARLPHASLPFAKRMKIKSEKANGAIQLVMEGPVDSTQRPKGRLDTSFDVDVLDGRVDANGASALCVSWLKTLPKTILLSSLLTLHISLHTSHQSAFADSVIPHMQKLVELVVLLPSEPCPSDGRYSKAYWKGLAANSHIFNCLLLLLQKRNPVLCPSLSELGVTVFIPSKSPSEGESVFDKILAIVHARSNIGYPIRRFFMQPSNSACRGYVFQSLDRSKDMSRHRKRLEGWLESIGQVVEVVDGLWDLDERDMEVFTSGSFYEDEEARAEQYWKLEDVDKPWASM